MWMLAAMGRHSQGSGNREAGMSYVTGGWDNQGTLPKEVSLGGCWEISRRNRQGPSISHQTCESLKFPVPGFDCCCCSWDMGCSYLVLKFHL